MIKIHTGRLFYLVARHKNGNISAVSENKTVASVIEYIKKNYMHEISLSEVAFACGFNDSNYFSYRFKKAYGVSPISVKNKR